MRLFTFISLSFLISCASKPNLDNYERVSKSFSCKYNYHLNKKKCQSSKMVTKEVMRIRRVIDFLRRNPESQVFANSSFQGILEKGMPIGLLITSWGNPKKINEYYHSNVRRRQLVYDSAIIYIENDRISSFHYY